MARARTIKPAFFTNEYLAELPALTRILFAGLWTLADREGRLENRPKRIKAQVMPYDDMNIERALYDLHEAGFILIYGDESQYIQIVKFTDHQSPHCKEVGSQIPAPDKHQTSTVQEPVEPPLIPYTLTLNPIDAPSVSDETSEPLFMELPTNNGKRYPITEGLVSEWGALYPAVDVRQEIRKAKGWLDSNPAKRKTYGGMKRFVNGWLSRCQDRGGSKGTDANAEFK